MQVEVWSDVVCPWCYIGKRRLEAALEKFPHRDQVEVIWRSFQLDPSVAEGLDYHLADGISGNTLRAHELLHLAAEHGLRNQLKERLLHAYFEEGRSVFDVESLVPFAVEVGLDEGEVREV